MYEVRIYTEKKMSQSFVFVFINIKLPFNLKQTVRQKNCNIQDFVNISLLHQ